LRPYGAALSTLAITGATGFVGRTLLRLALDQGHQVRALARKPQEPRPGVTWIAGDLDDITALETLVVGSDAVIHVAGMVSGRNRAAFEACNVNGTLAVANAARAAGVRRFVHVSSLAAREPHLSDYGWSKERAEQALAASGLDWTMVRPPAIYGPGDTEMLDLFRMARRGLLVLPPRGRLSIIEVSDLARLLLALVPDRTSIAAIYEPDDGAPDGWTHEGFARAIGWAVDRRVVTIATPKPLLKFVARIDTLFRRSRAKLTPDRVDYFCHPDWTVDASKRPPAKLWEPQVNTRGGLKATAAWYRRAGWMG
jgi:uncharacterized protein YbjT (DUF2867 family)